VTAVAAPTPTEHAAPLVRRSRKAPIAMGVFALLAVLLLVVFAPEGVSTFSFVSGQGFTLPLPALGTGIVVSAIAVVMSIVSGLWTRADRPTPTWFVGIFAFLLVVGFLVWASAGQRLPITGLLAGSLALAAPLIFGALGGVVSERVGVVNVAIEGQLLAGAFISAVAASVTHSAWAGLVGAIVAGMLVSFVLGAFAIKYVVNQVIVGIVLNVLVLGLTNFVYQTILVNDATTLNSPPIFHDFAIPGLSLIPVLGPVLFDQNVVVYLMYLAVAAVTVGLFRTRWGLRVRAVGEHPQAADTVGIDVNRTRFWNVALAGAIAGLGGAYFTVGSVGPFSQNMTSGAGFIALAAVIFGRWNPVRATLAALLFGFASNLQNVLGIIGSPVPNDFLLMLPYLVTIFAVAGLVGRVRGPAASGRPYEKG
jgi:general nucleoside transport system permease protein